MKAVAYIRISSSEQEYKRQHEELSELARFKNLNLVKVFADVVSGSKTKAKERASFEIMDKYLLDNSDVKNLLILETSRLGRKKLDVLNTIEDFFLRGVNIHIKDLNLCTMENGKRSITTDILVSLLSIMADEETRLLSERIKSGKMSKAKENKAFGAKVIGYKKGKDGTPIIDEKEAPIIKRIFELASQGLGMRKISAIIESEFNREFAIGTLSSIIKNSFHKGERKYKDLILDVPPIVSKGLWQKANDSINSRSKFGSRKYVNTNVVQGKIKCGVCNSVMYQKVIPKGRINSFVCKDTKCKNSINRPWLFRMIRLIVDKHALKNKDEKVREKIKLQITSHKAELQINNKLLAKLKRRSEKIRILWLDDEITDARYKSDISNVNKEIKLCNTKSKEIEKAIVIAEKSLKNDIEHYSKELSVFKTEIQDVLSHVIIDKERVLINIFGWREYDLSKPNSIKLGWEARKPISERYKNEKLPLRVPISDEDLNLMIDNYTL
ncbi:recombinase family protein [Tenacibaculum dicentrarchi]|uniref:recombinase family protein n=1 Tax=Tenacibaculum dicentrarchi TaxID=669041 RepID=UPI003512393C